jgi:dihydrofolate synthase/folylpolyglutamate synthase
MFKHLKEAVNWIESQLKFKPKSDLDRMRAAYRLLDLDLSHMKKIHVAGTNGKGSVCSYISHILIEAGYKVGTYTSPYLLTFNERIKLQFNDIPDDDLLELINYIYEFNQAFEKRYDEFLSFFELLTLMSLIYFSKEKVDVIVMEVGLGGLLDATNVVNYDLSLITSIGFDHMKQLGNTLESIAYNKLGILKKRNHLITTVDPSLHPQFKKHAEEVGATYSFYTLEDLEKLSDRPLTFMHNKVIYSPALLGDYQLLNSLLSIKAVHYLFPEISDGVINQGLKKTKWAGRLEEIYPAVFLDGAHNTHAIDAIEKIAKTTFKDLEVWVLFSALGDKDIKGMIEKIGSFASRVILTSFPDQRYQDLSIYQSDDIEFISNPKEAILKLRSELKATTVLLITGSLHFAGYIKSIIS